MPTNLMLRRTLPVIGLCSLLALVGCGAAADDFDPFSDNIDEDDPELNLSYANQHESDAVIAFDSAFPTGMQQNGKVYSGAQLKILLDDEEAWSRSGMPAETFMGMSIDHGSEQGVQLASYGAITAARRDRCNTSGTCKSSVEIRNGGFNLAYGYHCGAGWGSGTTEVYDDVDACCFYHDSNCWNISRGLDLGGAGCSSSINFIACVEDVRAQSPETSEAKKFILNSLLRVAADICELRPTWAAWARGNLYPLYPPAQSPILRCQKAPTASSLVTTGGLDR